MKSSNLSVLNITYVLLSPTFGMHQYTADLANRAGQWSGDRGQGPGVRGQESGGRGQEADDLADSQTVRLITTATAPRDRYSDAVQIHAPITAHGTGFSREGLNLAAYRRIMVAFGPEASSSQPGRTVREHRTSNIEHSTFDIPHSPFDIVHFTGVHAWNVPLVYALRRRGVPVIHTLHDLDPHTGVRFGALIRLWNRLIIGSGCHLLVHGRRYRDQLIAAGVPAGRVTVTPLLHGFLSAAHPWPPEGTGDRGQGSGDRGQGSGDRGQESGDIVHRPSYIPHSPFDIPHSPFHIPHSPSPVIFFGRVEAYKGAETLLNSWRQLKDLAGETHSSKRGETKEMREAGEAAGIRENSCHSWPKPRLIIAGPVAREVTLGPLPAGVELRDRRIMDDEADALFRAAGLLVLPYRDATQSALVAAAYAYGVPVIVTDAGALPEYVVEGETGWVVPPGDPAALAAALRAALSDPARLARMGVACRAWFDARRAEEATTLAEMYRHVSF